MSNTTPRPTPSASQAAAYAVGTPHTRRGLTRRMEGDHQIAMNEQARLNVPEWTVSELSAALKKTVEDAFGYVRVRGEISGYRGPHSSDTVILR